MKRSLSTELPVLFFLFCRFLRMVIPLLRKRHWQPDESSGLGYSLTRRPGWQDGRIHVSYSYHRADTDPGKSVKYSMFSEDWVKSAAREETERN